MTKKMYKQWKFVHCMCAYILMKKIHFSNPLVAVSHTSSVVCILSRELNRPVRVVKCVLEVTGSNLGCVIDYPGSEFSWFSSVLPNIFQYNNYMQRKLFYMSFQIHKLFNQPTIRHRRKKPWYPLDKRLGGPFEPVCTIWRRESTCLYRG
jgi:hypothetical protein